MTQRVIEISSPFFIHEEDLKAGRDIRSFFPRQAPLALEIGCGTGHFVLQMAERQPDTNFIAIDIYNKGCLKTCRKIEAAGLENIRVLRMEARYLLAHYLGAQSLSAIYVNCPDPWPKKRHRSRRLVNQDFLQSALFHLEPGGDFYFASDFFDYAEQVAEAFPQVPGYGNCLSSPYAAHLEGYPLSKYMRRFLDLGQPIHYVHYRKLADIHVEPADLPAVENGFRLCWSQVSHG